MLAVAPEHAIDTLVLSALLLVLAAHDNLARTHEEVFHRIVARSIGLLLDLTHDGEFLAPCLAIVQTLLEEIVGSVGPAGCVAGRTYITEEDGSRLVVGHERGIAKSVGRLRDGVIARRLLGGIAPTLGHSFLVAPGGTIVAASAHHDVHTAVAHVATAIAIVGSGNQCAVFRLDDSRDAVGVLGIFRIEKVLIGRSGIVDGGSCAVHRNVVDSYALLIRLAVIVNACEIIARKLGIAIGNGDGCALGRAHLELGQLAGSGQFAKVEARGCGLAVIGDGDGSHLAVDGQDVARHVDVDGQFAAYFVHGPA